MKSIKMIIAMILAVMVLVSSTCITAFAATSSTVKQYSSYLALGDSATRGNCASDGTDEYVASNDFEKNIIPYSYVDLVSKGVLGENRIVVSAEHVNDANMWNCAYPALTLAGVLGLLGLNDGEWDADYSLSIHWDEYGFSPDGRYDYALEYFGDEEVSYLPEDMSEYYEHHSEIGQFGSLTDIIKDTDFITINLGMGDVFFRAICLTLGNVFRGGAVDATQIPKVPYYVEEGYINWLKYYPALLDYIKEVNPDATVVLVGAMNMMFNARITEDMTLPIGDLGSIYTAKMNSMLKIWTELYRLKGLEIYYADTSNVESGCTEYDWNLMDHIIADYEPFTHPTRNGQSQIANSIFDVLPAAEETSAPVYKKTDIVLDLGRFNSVDTVKVNGITVKPNEYEMDGTTLVVHYGLISGSTLTVYINNENGTTTMMSYQLSYDIRDGYQVYRVYTTNDVEKTRYNASLAGKMANIRNLIVSSLGK